MKRDHTGLAWGVHVGKISSNDVAVAISHPLSTRGVVVVELPGYFRNIQVAEILRFTQTPIIHIYDYYRL